MEFHHLRAFWRLGLALAGILLVIIAIGYTQRMAEQVRFFEKQKIDWFKTAVEDYASREEDAYMLHGEIITADMEVPLILVNARGVIESARNYGPQRDTQRHFLERRLQRIQSGGYPPLELESGQMIYYEDSYLVARLRYMPVVLFLLIGLLIFLGYLGLQTSRRAEENRIWVGLARETAHQLGTPLSAILAWIEYLRSHAADHPQVMFAADEIGRDTQKLSLIADRFSKIGATPELSPCNIYDCLEQARAYMASRLPKRVALHFPNPHSPPVLAYLNAHLFEWVIENLLRNALDAMEGQGDIYATVHQDGRWVHIEVRDTGKGIPSRMHKQIFRPGFTTKKRGWGLGLSLAKRIIESYHKGRISVKHSSPGKGTTFAILLPRASEADV
jgi:signal transduction histidine kinase